MTFPACLLSSKYEMENTSILFILVDISVRSHGFLISVSLNETLESQINI